MFFFTKHAISHESSHCWFLAVNYFLWRGSYKTAKHILPTAVQHITFYWYRLVSGYNEKTWQRWHQVFAKWGVNYKLYKKILEDRKILDPLKNCIHLSLWPGPSLLPAKRSIGPRPDGVISTIDSFPGTGKKKIHHFGHWLEAMMMVILAF